jgi:hypothetical protein
MIGKGRSKKHEVKWSGQQRNRGVIYIALQKTYIFQS